MVEQNTTLSRRSFIAKTATITVGVSLLSASPQFAYAITAAEKNAEAQSALAKLKLLEDELASATDNYTSAKDSQEAAEAKMQKAQKEIDKASGQISELQDQLGTRARSMYRSGSITFLDILLGSTSFQAFATNWGILNDMNESDAEMVQQTKTLRSEVQAQEELYEQQASKAAAEAENAASVMSKAENLVSEMQATYDSLTEEAKELYKQEAAAREAQAALAEEVKSSSEQSAKSTNAKSEDSSGDTSEDSSGEPTKNTQESTSTKTSKKSTSSSKSSSSKSSSSTKSTSKSTSNSTSSSSSSSSSQSSSTSKSSSSSGNAIVERAKSQLGVPYSYGAGMPGVAFDCSGLVGYAVTGKSGHALGGTGSIIGLTRVSNPRPGDICVVHNSSRQHCGIYVSAGTMIHAPHTGAVVSYGSITSDMVYVRY